MKVELIKQIKENGDVYYSTFVDGVQIAGTTTYAGNIIEEKEDAVGRAMVKLHLVKKVFENNQIPAESVIYSEEI